MRKLSLDELNNVSGGIITPSTPTPINCPVCLNQFDANRAESKTVKKGCTKKNVYKCARCGQWLDTSSDAWYD